MIQIPNFSVSGTKLTAIKAADKIFKARINQRLMAEAVRIYLANRRAAAARTKDRGDVAVTHAKVWRQKGTGRARHGSRNAPVFVGGAKAHGPTGKQNYYRRLSRAQKRAGLFSALSTQLKEKNVIAVSGWEKLTVKTKTFDQVFAKLKLDKAKLLLILGADRPKWFRGIRNLTYLTILPAVELSVYPVLNAKKIIFTQEGLASLEKHYA